MRRGGSTMPLILLAILACETKKEPAYRIEHFDLPKSATVSEILIFGCHLASRAKN